MGYMCENGKCHEMECGPGGSFLFLVFDEAVGRKLGFGGYTVGIPHERIWGPSYMAYRHKYIVLFLSVAILVPRRMPAASRHHRRRRHRRHHRHNHRRHYASRPQAGAGATC